MLDTNYKHQNISNNKPDIIDILIAEGINLKQKGTNFWALCPFHIEKNPSFKVDSEKQFFYCFGCHEHGDVITFIQKYKGLSFNETLLYLGISKSKLKFNLNPEEAKKRKLIKEYYQLLNNYTNFLCNILRRLARAKMRAKKIREVEAMAFHYHSEFIWEYHFEILLSNDERAKFELYKELKYERK